MTERTTVRLPPELLASAKRKAAAEGRTLTSLIEDGLRLVIAPTPPSKAKRVLPRVSIPVSKAKGGPNPGFEFIRLKDIDAIDDAEYVERMNRGFK